MIVRGDLLQLDSSEGILVEQAVGFRHDGADAN